MGNLARLAILFLALCTAQAESADGAVCQRLAAAAAREHKLPADLLGAIALAESGRWDGARQATVAWPWTIYAEGRGRYLPSKEAAVAEARKLQARGVANIDVGCMQVNLGWHAQAFASLEEALDPAANVGYAARFFKSLQARTRSWTQAVAFYHSTSAEKNRPYRDRVMKLWRGEIRRAAEERRQQTLARRESRRVD